MGDQVMPVGANMASTGFEAAGRGQDVRSVSGGETFLRCWVVPQPGRLRHMRKDRPCRSSAIFARSPRAFASRLKAFHEGLGETGFVEGRDVAIDYQWAEGQYKRLPALAADLVARNVDVIVAAGGAPVALAAKASTASKTIVFEMGGDPVQLGVVDSLSRPGGNITGVSSLSVEVSPKRLEFMHELLPTAATLAVVANPTSPTVNSQLENLRSAAEILGCACRFCTPAVNRSSNLFSPPPLRYRQANSSSPRTLTLRFAVGSLPRSPCDTACPQSPNLVTFRLQEA